MADTRPTKINFFHGVYLCLLLLFAPNKFLTEEEKDDKIRQGRTDKQTQERSVFIVRKAFYKSLILVGVAGFAGGSVGLLIGRFVGCANPTFITALQVGGALILLWGTLFVRGWEIETYSGVQLTERVNQWLYRFLYFTGTALLVLSLTWQQC